MLGVSAKPKSEQIKINIEKTEKEKTETSSSKIDVTEATLVEEVFRKIKIINQPETTEENKASIYIALRDPKKVHLTNQLLRCLRPDEHILDPHSALSEKRIPHEFYVLKPVKYMLRDEKKNVVFDEKFFKNGTSPFSPSRKVGKNGRIA